MNTNTKGGARQPRKLTVDIDLATGEATMTTEGFTGPVECRTFSQPYEALMGEATSKDTDTPEAAKKPTVNRQSGA